MEQPPELKSKLWRQLLAWFQGIALVPLAAVLLAGYLSSEAALQEKVTGVLEAVARRQANQIQAYLEERENDAATLARDPTVIRTLPLLSAGNRRAGEQLRSFLTHYRDAGEYQDLFLISPEGRVVFSVERESDVDADLREPPYRDSELGRIFDRTTTLLSTEISELDLHPVTGQPAFFVGAPVLERSGLVGIILLEARTERMFAVVNDVTGLGRTGETVVAAPSQGGLTFLAPTRFDPEAAFSRRLALDQAGPLLQASRGTKGEGLVRDYRDQDVLAVWRYFPFLRAGLMVKMDAAEAMAPLRGVRATILAVALLTAVGVVFLARRVARSVTRPVEELTRTSEAVAAGDLSQTVTVKADNELGRLAFTFNQMTAQLRESIAQLTATTQAKERIESELRIAHDIQLSILPKIFPPFLNMPQFDVFATIEPMREVGGDLYDFFLIDEERLLIMIGDVSGKGVPAALFMAVTKTLFKAVAAGETRVGKLMARVNDELCADNETGMFVTVFCGVLEVKTGRFEYANGGHNPPYVRRGDGRLEKLPLTGGMGLGVMDGMDYDTEVVELGQGDVLFLYTDGVTEAQDAAGEFYMEERLEAFLGALDCRSPREVVGRTMTEMQRFAAGADQADDITVVTLTYYGASRSAAEDSDRLSITLANDLSELARLTERVEGFARINRLSEKMVFQVNLALEELITNVIKFGFPHDVRTHLIDVDLSLVGDELVITVEDDGVAFDPFSVEEPDVELSAEEREVGGLGVHLVRSFFTRCEYERREGKNVTRVGRRMEG